MEKSEQRADVSEEAGRHPVSEDVVQVSITAPGISEVQ